MFDARFKLALTPTAASGLIGGYADIETWYLHMVKNWSTHHQSYGRSSAPSIYKAMRRLADARPDPQTGAKRAISSALAVNFTQVQVLAPDPAALAEARSRRYVGVPYNGTPLQRSAQEESAIAAGAAESGVVAR
jgi:hypothetical protein